MDTTRLTLLADHHTNAILTDGGTVARTVAVWLAVARTRVLTIAATYASSTNRLGVNHV